MTGFAFALLVLADQPGFAADEAGERFCREFHAALAAKNVARVVALADNTGLTEEARNRQAATLSALVARGEIFSVSLGPLPDDFPLFLVAHGKRHEPSLPPVGVVNVTFRVQNGLTSEQLPYAIVGGRYRLVTTRTVDLGWTGPPDVSLGLLVSGRGAEQAVVRVRYNASGVDIMQTIRAPSAILWGQDFEEIVVTTDVPNADLTLTVARDGKEIFQSPGGQKASRVRYVKPAPPPAKPDPPRYRI